MYELNVSVHYFYLQFDEMRTSTDPELTGLPTRHFHLQCQALFGCNQTTDQSSDHQSQLHRSTDQNSGKTRSHSQVQHQRSVIGQTRVSLGHRRWSQIIRPLSTKLGEPKKSMGKSANGRIICGNHHQ